MRKNAAGYPLPDVKVGDMLLLYYKDWTPGPGGRNEIEVARVTGPETAEWLYAITPQGIDARFDQYFEPGCTRTMNIGPDASWRIEVVGRGDADAKEG